MSFSYSGDPSTSDKDYIRFTLGDTKDVGHIFEDEEIEAVLHTIGSPDGAVQQLIIDQMSRVVDEVDYTIGPETVKASQKFENLKKLWDLKHKRQAQQSPPMGGFAASEGTHPPIFKLGMMDNA